MVPSLCGRSVNLFLASCRGELEARGQAMESLGTGARRETEGELLAAVAAPLSEVSSTNWPCSV